MDGSLTPAGVRALRDGGQPFTLLDVRRRAAVDADPHLVPGAVWRDPAEVAGWAPGLLLDRRVVVYCAHGHEVSHAVRDHLRRRSIDAALVVGGLAAWRAAGGETVPAEATGHFWAVDEAGKLAQSLRAAPDKANVAKS